MTKTERFRTVSFIHHIQQVKFVATSLLEWGANRRKALAHIHCPLPSPALSLFWNSMPLEELLPGPDGGG
jgi:hypothetical protein